MDGWVITVSYYNTSSSLSSTKLIISYHIISDHNPIAMATLATIAITAKTETVLSIVFSQLHPIYHCAGNLLLTGKVELVRCRRGMLM